MCGILGFSVSSYFKFGLGFACCNGFVTCREDRRAQGKGSGEGEGAITKPQSAPDACTLHCSIINFCRMLPAFFFFHCNSLVLLSCLVFISHFLYQFYPEQK